MEEHADMKMKREPQDKRFHAFRTGCLKIVLWNYRMCYVQPHVTRNYVPINFTSVFTVGVQKEGDYLYA